MPSGAVAEAAAELARCYDLAGRLVAAPDQGEALFVTAPAMITAALPGNPAALAVVVDVHAGIRRLERALLGRLASLDGRAPRGCSGANTRKALERVVALCEPLGQDEAAAVAHVLDRWAGAARRLPAIDEDVIWLPVRPRGRAGDEPVPPLPPACPWCETLSLRVADRLGGVVACFRPGCADGDGSRPVGQLRYDRYGEPEIGWADGTVQRPRAG